MTADDIRKAREIIATYGSRFLFHDLGLKALTGWPEALDEVERLEQISANQFRGMTHMEQELVKLRTVAEAADRFFEIEQRYEKDVRVCASEVTDAQGELRAALKAWREK